MQRRSNTCEVEYRLVAFNIILTNFEYKGLLSGFKLVYYKLHTLYSGVIQPLMFEPETDSQEEEE